MQAWMTFPRAVRERLMYLASSTCWRLREAAEFWRSEPARSTRANLEPAGDASERPGLLSMCTKKTVCDRLLLAFLSDVPRRRAFMPAW